MQVEESGNMINMALHYAQLAGKKVATPYLKKHYKIMQQWAEYLVEDSLIPSNQLSTDDFAGPLANQTNLAIKGIEGIAALGQIATMLGKTKDAKNYQNISTSYIDIFQKYAINSKKTHTKLAYQDDKSWGTLYNLFFDRLLNLKLVPKSLYDLQDNYYPTVQQDFGVVSLNHLPSVDSFQFKINVFDSLKTDKPLLLFQFISFSLWILDTTGPRPTGRCSLLPLAQRSRQETSSSISFTNSFRMEELILLSLISWNRPLATLRSNLSIQTFIS